MLDVFENKQTRIKKNHIKNLIALAKADGKLDKKEVSLIKKLAKDNGVKLSKVQYWLKQNHIVDINPDASIDQKFDQIYDLVQLMLADGKVDEEELEFCSQVAKNLGFKKTIVGLLVRKISMSASVGMNKDRIKEESGNFLHY